MTWSVAYCAWIGVCCITGTYNISENLKLLFLNGQLGREATSEKGNCSLCWEESKEEIDLASLALKEPILFYDEVGNWEDN